MGSGQVDVVIILFTFERNAYESDSFHVTLSPCISASKQLNYHLPLVWVSSVAQFSLFLVSSSHKHPPTNLRRKTIIILSNLIENFLLFDISLKKIKSYTLVFLHLSNQTSEVPCCIIFCACRILIAAIGMHWLCIFLLKAVLFLLQI